MCGFEQKIIFLVKKLPDNNLCHWANGESAPLTGSSQGLMCIIACTGTWLSRFACVSALKLQYNDIWEVTFTAADSKIWTVFLVLHDSVHASTFHRPIHEKTETKIRWLFNSTCNTCNSRSDICLKATQSQNPHVVYACRAPQLVSHLDYMTPEGLV